MKAPRLAPPRPRLGNTRNIFPRVGAADIVRAQRRSRRNKLRDVLWHLSKLKRVRACGRYPIGSGVSLVDHGGVAHYRGLAVCGSISACPPCSAKIRNGRAIDISTGAANWMNAGNTVLACAFTAPHDLSMRLDPLFSVIAEAFTFVISGRKWRRLKELVPIVGQIRAIEVTCGCNGWHPHLHVLIFIEGQITSTQLASVVLHLRGQWSKFIVRAGYRPPSDLHGVDVQVCRSAKEAGAYIAKTQDGRSPGNEIARGDLKSGKDGHLTPFQILGEIADTGDLALLPLWREYEQATRGRQIITWSKGLRQILGLAAPEKSDGELAEEDVGGEVVCEMTTSAWRVVVRNLGLNTRLLEAYESGGISVVIAVAARHGLIPDPAPPGPVPRLIKVAS